MTTSRYPLGATIVPSSASFEHAEQIGREIVSPGHVEGREHLQHCSVIGLQHLKAVVRRAIADIEKRAARLRSRRLLRRTCP
jgi:hypothetical protein